MEAELRTVDFDFNDERVSNLGDRRMCGICSGETQQHNYPTEFRFGRGKVILESWRCNNCQTQGNILREMDTGDICRLSHLHTGAGFEHPQEN